MTRTRIFTEVTKKRIAMWLARHLPKRVVMWCALRLIAYATQGEYGYTNVSSLTAMDALKRWETT